MAEAAAPRFPAYAWAWPKGGRDLLLKAAALPDLERAAASFLIWQDRHDFNLVTFAEQRLLVAISARLPEAVLAGPARARLKGIERMLWTHSTVALQAARPALTLLGEAGIPMMVLKGAARAALDLKDLRGRFASDVDVLVPREDFARAYACLTDAEWAPVQTREPRLSRIIGINLRRGSHGDLDLHKYPFHQLVAADADQSGLWDRASHAVFLGQSVSVPAATDRLLMAIAHGGIDAHQHSDWLVDCAALIHGNPIDWSQFERACSLRGLESHAAIALTYLATALEVDVPPAMLHRLTHKGRNAPVQLWSALVQARPKSEHGRISSLARGLARGDRQVRKAHALWQLERTKA